MAVSKAKAPVSRRRKAARRSRGSTPSDARLTDLQQELMCTLMQVAPLLPGQAVAVVEDLSESNGLEPETVAAQLLERLQKQLGVWPAALLEREVYPQVSGEQERQAALDRLQRDVVAALRRVALRRSLQPQEKREILRGMLRTRYLDARLKKFFTSGEVKMADGTPFQGKGFRSMGQEAIYAAGIRLRRLQNGASADPYDGDLVAPMIRDLGLALAMGVKPYDVMAAQMGKPGLPTNGKDLHIGDFSCGVLPPAAPIGISTGTACGLGLALKGSGRVVVSCIGDGGTSIGEWHEVVNFAAVQKMPLVFILQNNQTALSTPTHEQFACRRLAERAVGYGIRGVTIDGTDPEAIFAAVTEAADACRRGEGPVLVELVAMRICGHAHHDDMLYFGYEPDQFLEYPEPKEGGYIDLQKYAYWRRKDPIARYRKQLEAEGYVDAQTYETMVEGVQQEIESAAQQVIDAPWPDAESAFDPIVLGGPKVMHVEPLAGRRYPFPEPVHWHSDEPAGFNSDPKGKTFWQAIAEALEEEMERDPSVFILGEDVGGRYGNAFVILRSLLGRFGDRILNTPLAEAAILGAATGAALLGKRPVAEIQFNDFVACGFNQLVNNAAKIFPRWGQPVPMTVRLPWGGLRQAGPYHSQNTEPWFYRVPGLKIVCPSTPREAKGLLKAAIRDDNPVLYYEHIALYRAAAIKQHLPAAEEDFLLPIGKAHLKRTGTDITLITYGMYVHTCLRVAERLAEEEGISCEVLDLRTLLPLDKAAIFASVQRTGRVAIVHEDSKTGSIGQSIASIIAEEAFEYLDAPVRVLGSLDTPVPYSPPLEEAFLVSDGQIAEAVRLLLAY